MSKNKNPDGTVTENPFAGPEPVTPSDDPLMGLTPSLPSGGREKNTDPWKRMLRDYGKDSAGFLSRCREPSKLTAADINILMTALEESAGEGTTLDIFAAELRLTESEIGDMVAAHPLSVGRSIELARARRKEFVLEGARGQIFRNSSVLKTFLDNPAFKDLFQAAEEEKGTMTPEERVELALMDKGIEPCHYASAVFLVGDTGGAMDEPPGLEEDMKRLGAVPTAELEKIIVRMASSRKSAKVDTSGETVTESPHGQVETDAGTGKGEILPTPSETGLFKVSKGFRVRFTPPDSGKGAG